MSAKKSEVKRSAQINEVSLVSLSCCFQCASSPVQHALLCCLFCQSNRLLRTAISIEISTFTSVAGSFLFSQEVLCISLTFCEQIVQLQELFGQEREDPATDHFTFEKDLISFSHLITEMK